MNSNAIIVFSGTDYFRHSIIYRVVAKRLMSTHLVVGPSMDTSVPASMSQSRYETLLLRLSILCVGILMNRKYKMLG